MGLDSLEDKDVLLLAIYCLFGRISVFAHGKYGVLDF